MTVEKIAKKCNLEILNLGDKDAKITGIYCCDLLSIVMGKAFEGCAWVTIMGNINSMAVATLAEMSCIVLAQNTVPDENALKKAVEKNITVLRSKEPIFETALFIHEALKDG